MGDHWGEIRGQQMRLVLGLTWCMHMHCCWVVEARPVAWSEMRSGGRGVSQAERAEPMPRGRVVVLFVDAMHCSRRKMGPPMFAAAVPRALGCSLTRHPPFSPSLSRRHAASTRAWQFPPMHALVQAS